MTTKEEFRQKLTEHGITTVDTKPAKTVEPKPVKKALRDMTATEKAKLKTVDLSNMFVSKHWTLAEANESNMPIKYVVGKDGVYEIRDTKLGRAIVKVKNIIVGDNIKESFELRLPAKLPAEMWYQTVAFFKEVMRIYDGSEAILQFFWNKETNNYFMYCPTQKVGGASCEYDHDEQLEANNLLVLDIHSHNSMSAFFSTTDDSDDQSDHITGVVGKLNSDDPEYKFRWGVNGSWKEVSITDIFDLDMPKATFPDVWMSRVSKEVSYSKSYGKGKHGVSFTDGYRGRSQSDDWWNKRDIYDPEAYDEYEEYFRTGVDAPPKSVAQGEEPATTSKRESTVNKVLEYIEENWSDDEVTDLCTRLALLGYADILEACLSACVGYSSK